MGFFLFGYGLLVFHGSIVVSLTWAGIALRILFSFTQRGKGSKDAKFFYLASWRCLFFAFLPASFFQAKAQSQPAASK